MERSPTKFPERSESAVRSGVRCRGARKPQPQPFLGLSVTFYKAMDSSFWNRTDRGYSSRIQPTAMP